MTKLHWWLLGDAKWRLHQQKTTGKHGGPHGWFSRKKRRQDSAFLSNGLKWLKTHRWRTCDLSIDNLRFTQQWRPWGPETTCGWLKSMDHLREGSIYFFAPWCWTIYHHLPSGKRLQNYGKSPFYSWVNQLFLWPFSSSRTVNVYQHLPHFHDPLFWSII